jgi:adenylylsulfate reductase subunit B
MVLNKDIMKAYNQEPNLCWECMCCVKICPVQAMEVRGYADFVPMGAAVTPLRSTDSIMWTVKFRGGKLKRFKFPIRTTPEGQAQPNGDYNEGDGDLNSQMLVTEPESCGMSELPRVK